MKLKNKLLPLVGVSAACAAVTPIALTSCKNDSSDLVNLLQKYNYTITDIPKSASGTKDKAEKIYFSAANANPNIFIDDYYGSTAFENTVLEEETSWISGYYKFTKDLEKISNVSFKKYTVEIEEETTDIGTISCDKQFEEQEQSGAYIYSGQGTIKFVNAPVALNHSDNVGNISVLDGSEKDDDTGEFLYQKYGEALGADSVESSINLDTTVTTTYPDSSYEYITAFKTNLCDETSFNKVIDGDDYGKFSDYIGPEATTLGYSHYLFNISEDEE